MIREQCGGRGIVQTDSESYKCHECDGMPAAREHILDDFVHDRILQLCDEAGLISLPRQHGRHAIAKWQEIRESLLRSISGIDSQQSACERTQEPTAHIIGTINGTACEIEYRDSNGKIVGQWAYGAFNPSYPYQGARLPPVTEPTTAQ